MAELKPTEAELAILEVLWQRGPSTVREVHDALEGRRPVGYTTVLKLMQIMGDKGLVDRDESERAHVYHARPSREQAQKCLVSDLVSRAFGGSAQKMVMSALAHERVSPEELAAIRELIDRMEEGES